MASGRTSSLPTVGGQLGSKLFLTVVVVVVVVLLTAFVVAVSGGVTGHEFCPETFSLRSVQYYQLPLIRFQVTPTIRTDQSTNALLAHIRGRESWTTSQNQAHWDVAHASGHRWDYVGDADVLYQYLMAENEENQNPWVAWSQANPQLAEIVWPVIMDAARKRQYLLIPQLLDRATSAESPTALSTSLQQLLEDSAGWLAQLAPPPAANPRPKPNPAP